MKRQIGIPVACVLTLLAAGCAAEAAASDLPESARVDELRMVDKRGGQCEIFPGDEVVAVESAQFEFTNSSRPESMVRVRYEDHGNAGISGWYKQGEQCTPSDQIWIDEQTYREMDDRFKQRDETERERGEEIRQLAGGALSNATDDRRMPIWHDKQVQALPSPYGEDWEMATGAAWSHECTATKYGTVRIVAQQDGKWLVQFKPPQMGGPVGECNTATVFFLSDAELSELTRV